MLTPSELHYDNENANLKDSYLAKENERVEPKLKASIKLYLGVVI